MYFEFSQESKLLSSEGNMWLVFMKDCKKKGGGGSILLRKVKGQEVVIKDISLMVTRPGV